ncbi:hypothetical protein B0H16DRAFT_1457789 [Mycena metata]|uniref:Uncharacterized protein n=1 Tax=Mycena metata TaxID=1033252 RepID=A0AAD7NES5_9AGAR|nr:hypothetical protein B0H16DRAFT_1457789 [Mycena metata]
MSLSFRLPFYPVSDRSKTQELSLVSPSPNHAPAELAINNFAVADLVEDTTGIPNTPTLPVASAFVASIFPAERARNAADISALRAQQISSSAELVLELGQENWTKCDSRRSDASSESNPVNLNRAREKVAELEAETSTLLRQSSHSSESHQEGIPSETSDVSADDLNSSGIYGRLERAIQQIEGLNDRIRELERERRSSWALGLSDEAPPGYIE